MIVGGTRANIIIAFAIFLFIGIIRGWISLWMLAAAGVFGAKDACRRQHPQRDPTANNADKQENREGDNDVGAGAADDHVGQNAKCDGADQEEQPGFG